MTAVNFLTNPELRRRLQVVLSESGAPLEDVAWADDVANQYALVVMRPKTFSDGPDADLRVRKPNGTFAVTATRSAAIEFVDLTVDPLKQEFLRLLHDPEVVRRMKAALSR